MSDKITCRNCHWTTDRKHFGFIQTEENVKKFGENHLCMVCYVSCNKPTKDEVVKHYSENLEIEWEGFDADWIY